MSSAPTPPPTPPPSTEADAFSAQAAHLCANLSSLWERREVLLALHGWLLLAENVAYGNGINGLVVHRTDRVVVRDNFLYDNGKVSRDPPSSRQRYAGLEVTHSRQVVLAGNVVLVTNADDAAYASGGNSSFVDAAAPSYYCNGRVASEYGGRVEL